MPSPHPLLEASSLSFVPDLTLPGRWAFKAQQREDDTPDNSYVPCAGNPAHQGLCMHGTRVQQCEYAGQYHTKVESEVHRQ